MKITQLYELIPSAEKGLDKTFRGAKELFRAQIKNKTAQLWQIEHDSWMITRVEKEGNEKPELVVCCFQGKNLRQVTQKIVSSAKAQGFGSIRYHTQHKGLNRLLKGYEFEPLETVYRRVL